MIRLRPYKSCDAKVITTWCKDEETYIKWSGERFGSFPISACSVNSKYQHHNGDCIEPDNFYPMTAFDENGIIGHLIMRYIKGNNKILRFGWVIVDSNKRGQGYGKQMLALSLKYAFEILIVDKVTIEVFENNLSAYYCYRAVGFSEVIMTSEKYEVINGKKWKLIELEMSQTEYYNNVINNVKKSLF